MTNLGQRSGATFSLYEIAPRLALARDQHNAEVRRQQMHALNVVIDRHELERLIAHRELQLQRAFRTRDGKYIAERQRKLRSAQQRLAQLNQREAA